MKLEKCQLVVQFLLVSSLFLGLHFGGVGYFARYSYTFNNPVNFIDPDGTCTGSRLKNKSGGCLSTGGYTTGLRSYGHVSLAIQADQKVTITHNQGASIRGAKTFGGLEEGAEIPNTGQCCYATERKAAEAASLAADSLAAKYYPSEHRKKKFIPEIGAEILEAHPGSEKPYSFGNFIVGVGTRTKQGLVLIEASYNAVSTIHMHWTNTKPSGDTLSGDVYRLRQAKRIMKKRGYKHAKTFGGYIGAYRGRVGRRY